MCCTRGRIAYGSWEVVEMCQSPVKMLRWVRRRRRKKERVCVPAKDPKQSQQQNTSLCQKRQVRHNLPKASALSLTYYLSLKLPLHNTEVTSILRTSLL